MASKRIENINEAVKEYVASVARWRRDRYKGEIPKDVFISVENLVSEGLIFLKEKRID